MALTSEGKFNLFNWHINSKITKFLLKEKVEYYTLEGSSLFKSKKYSEAIDLLDKAIELNPNHLSALFKKGMALYQMRDFKEANDYFSKVIQSDPNHTQALFNKGKTFYKLKKYQDADEHFNQTLKCEANFSKLFYYKGKINLKNNKLNEAIECFDKSLDGSEHVEESYFNKAIILSKLRKFTESQESFDKAFKLNPNLKNSTEYRDFLHHLNELEKKENIDTNKVTYTIHIKGQYKVMYQFRKYNFVLLKYFNNYLEKKDCRIVSHRLRWKKCLIPFNYLDI